MDLLKELIDSLEDGDQRNFKIFLNRFRKKDERKDLDLFNFYLKGKIDKRDKILASLYPDDKNLEAYHATRKRLIRQLIEFISAKGKSEDVTSERHIENLLFISRYFFERKCDQAAWSFLLQAEQLAKKGENYKLLNNIYSYQIENSFSEHAPELKSIIAEKEKYQYLALEDDNANIAYHLIRHELNESLEENKEIDIHTIIKRVLKAYKLTDIVLERPRLMYNIIAITRSAILATKEYPKFESYVIEKYKEVDKKGSFSKYNHVYKVNILYMIAHVLYRNKKFKEALSYLELLYQSLLEFNKSQYLSFYPKYSLLLSAVYNYSGKNKLAIELLEKLLIDKKIKMDKSTLLNTYLNLSIYYFQKEDYNKSIRMFQNVQHSDKWLSKIMGREWVLKKNIVESINQYELGNSDLVDVRIKAMQKNFKDLFNRQLYARVGTFLKLVKELNENPRIATTKQFAELVDSSFVFVRAEEEDIQAMSFYLWIASKMKKKNYYDLLISTLNFREE